jgi:hypothetical protein
MKHMKNILKIMFLSIVLLLVILSIVSYIFGERVIKIGIESAATKALGVGVYVGDIDFSIIRGSVGIDDLVVKNPKGYAFEDLLKLGRGKVAVGIGSLLSETVQIKEIKLENMELTIEQKGLSNNLQDVISSLPAKEKQPQAEPEEKNLRIDELEITGVKVTVKLLPVPGKADTVVLNLPPIRMQNLGTDDKLSMAQLSSKVLLAITDAVARQGRGVLPGEMVNAMKSTLDKTLGLAKTVTEEGKKLIDVGKDAGTGVIEGFKGLLKPSKKK